jgi:uncharacterized membrane protein
LLSATAENVEGVLSMVEVLLRIANVLVLYVGMNEDTKGLVPVLLLLLMPLLVPLHCNIIIVVDTIMMISCWYNNNNIMMMMIHGEE